MSGYSGVAISQTLVEKVGEHSVFAIIWDRVNLEGNIAVNQLSDMVRQLDLMLELDGFLMEDGLIRERVARITLNLQNNPIEAANNLILDKLQTFDLLIDILQDIKIIDMNQSKLYGTWADGHGLYIDDENTIIKRNHHDSIYNNLDTVMQESKYLVDDSQCCLTDSDDDNDDDMMSLMGLTHKRTLSSPSTIQESNFFPESEKFSIKNSIESLQQVHNSLDVKFNTIELNLRQITLQNSKDRNSLLDLSFKNDQMLQKLDLIKLQTKSLSIKLNLFKLNLNNPEISSKSWLNSPPDSISLVSSSPITSPTTIASPACYSLDKSVDYINVDDVSFDIINDTFEDLLPNFNSRILSSPSIDAFLNKHEILDDFQLTTLPSSQSGSQQDDLESIDETINEPIIAENQPPSEIDPSNTNTELIKPRSLFPLQSIATLIIIILSYIASYFCNSGS